MACTFQLNSRVDDTLVVCRPTCFTRRMTLPSLVFEIAEPGVDGRRVSVRAEVLKIGRSSAWPLGLLNAEVGRMHAVIEVTEDGQVTLIDLGGSPQVRVNGSEVNRTELRAGDRIEIGRSTLSLVAVGDDVAMPGSAGPEANPAVAFGEDPGINRLGTPRAASSPGPAPERGQAWRWEDTPRKARETRPSWLGIVTLLVLLVLGAVVLVTRL